MQIGICTIFLWHFDNFVIYILYNFLRGKMFDIKSITEDDAKKQLKYLASEIEKADIAYYQNDEPYLDDAQYD